MPHRPTVYSRATRRLAAALLLAAALNGCSYIPWLGGDKDPTPPTKLTELVPEATLNVLWSERVTKGSQGRRLFLVPALGGGRIYVADARGSVVAVNADNGRVLWERDTKLPFSAGPDLEGDRLVLGTTSGLAVALSASDGHELWRVQLSGEVLSVPRYSGTGQVIVHTLDDTVTALDAAKGSEVWRVSYPAPILTLRGSSTPAVVPGGILVGLSGGKLIKLDAADGTPLWEVTVTPPRGRSELARIADVDADPVVVGKLIFVGTYNGDLAAVDLDSGAILWRRQLSSHAGIAANATALFVTDSEDRVWAADPAGGAGRWRQERLKNRQLTAPALVGNQIVVGDIDGWVHLMAQGDGRLLGRTRVAKHAIMARPTVSSGQVYVYASDGTLAALTVGAAPGGSRGTSNQPAEAGDRASIPEEGPSAAPSYPSAIPPP
jgi:outer membrane protein assembly factor BamB